MVKKKKQTRTKKNKQKTSLKRAAMVGYYLNSVTIVLGLLRLGKEGLAQCVSSKNKTVEWPQPRPSEASEGSSGSSPKPMARQQMLVT